jgi:7-keto-8-aminopelargonate synthetase-like enzyme
LKEYNLSSRVSQRVVTNKSIVVEAAIDLVSNEEPEEDEFSIRPDHMVSQNIMSEDYLGLDRVEPVVEEVEKETRSIHNESKKSK